jgi:two-component system, OmpR family, phosphate regulon sensor histidine kinase PhoR
MKRPWKSRAAVKFFLSYLAIVVFLFVVFYFYAVSAIKDFHIASLSSKMRDEARLASRLLPLDQSGPALDQICRDLERDFGVRITVIDLNGKVLGDSEEVSSSMENHGGRPEVLQAVATGTGTSARYSTTVKHEMLYRAVLEAANRRVIRLSVPLGSIEEAEHSIRHAILVGLLLFSGLGLLPVFFFSAQLERRVQRMVDFSESVSRGSFPAAITLGREDEFTILERNLNAMSLAIQQTIRGVVSEKEKLDSILRCMTEGVLVLDTRGRLMLSNQNAQKMFGLSAATVQGASLLEVSRHPEMRKLADEVLSRDLSSERYVKELSFDDSRWLSVTAADLRGADEKPAGYILVFHDVTELKRLETMRADLVANVSHELRTPLTAIRGYAETLLQSPPADPKEAERFLDIIQRHSERLGRLIDDLLTLSDLESGKIQLNPEKLRPADLIHRVLEIFHDRAGKKNIELAERPAPALPVVVGDSDRLQQLLINLIDNALKYTPAAGRIEVRAAPAGDDAIPMVEIAVADTGCGIPEKDLPRLTERFYRVDKARSRELGGTGLGLAIVKHIVQAHGGRLEIESRMQKGTTVRVFLPADNGAVTPRTENRNGKTLRSAP